ncbi:hypothetical protein DBR11_01590 [Pedobacter sp. HMWF019]|uniref:hypothetical protein n=1 Tax=Pedobacter sp. HMWF019 TaxID=2056856 RepID=UPI000D3D6F53|nr:hypothetical protein [Pedobacter sp. HMWF019]PTT03696.1 hypothetical protein DBR11_01590 [Pedobacter sp. HMWF019]
MKNLILICLIWLSILQNAFSQNITLTNQVPPSPEALSLFKFTELPVSKFTGIPDINIPLYEIQRKGLSLPIELRYHSGGIKVSEVSSSVGTGWAFSCGGIITQTICGIDDYYSSPSNFGRFQKPTNMKNPSICDVKASVENQQDNAPDVFSYSFCGNTGSFFLDTVGTPVQIAEQRLKIENFYGSGGDFNNGLSGMGWKVTDTKGTQYIFETLEVSTTRSQLVYNATKDVLSPGSVNTKTWYLNKVISVAGDTVSFKYASRSTIDYIYTGSIKYRDPEDHSLNGNGATQPLPVSFYDENHFFLQQLVERKILQSVSFLDGNIQFEQGGNRCDFYGDTYLKKMTIYNSNNLKLKEYDLNYKYMIGNQFKELSEIDCSSEVPFASTSETVTHNPFATRRLFLTSLDEIDGISNKVDSYGMEYEHDYGLPERFSAQQDLLGYYNGNGYNTLLQNIVLNGETVNGARGYTILGKEPNYVYAKQGLLKKMIYPTGGYSTFDYELNTRAVDIPNSNTHETAIYTVPLGAVGNSNTLTTFSVNDISGAVNISFQVDVCKYGASGQRGSFSIVNAQNNSVVVSESNVAAKGYNQKINFNLPNGNYILKSAGNNFPCAYQVTMFGWQDIQPGSSKVTQNYGGLRIKAIGTFDPVTQSLLNKQYQYTLPNGQSSMALFNPSAKYNNQSFVVYGFAGTLTYIITGAIATQITSNTHYPLASSQNGLFGYAYVVEKATTLIDGTVVDNGYIVSQSDTLTKDISNVSNTLPFHGGNWADGSWYSKLMTDRFPWAPNTDFSWARGKTLKEEQYKRNVDGTYSCVLRKNNFYSKTFTANGYGYTSGYKVKGIDLQPLVTCGNGFNLQVNYNDLFMATKYNIYAGYQLLDSTISVSLDNNFNETKTSTYYTYNTTNLLPSTIKTTRSDNKYSITKISYPSDFVLTGIPNNDIAKGVQNLQKNYAIGEPVEEYKQVSDLGGNGLKTTSATFYKYKTSLPFVDTVFRWENSPNNIAFVPSIITSNSTTKDGNYKPIIYFNAYDRLGNIQEQSLVSGTKEVYLWGYNSSYPVAKIVGSSYNEVKQVINQSILDNGSTTDIQMRSELDKLRQSLTNAQVTTYTYKPLVGMTSSTDPKGQIVYYEYDDFMRLKNVKDQNGHIVKNYTYHYKP